MTCAGVMLLLAGSLGCNDDPQQNYNCDQGTFSMETTATATGFAHPDGTPVTATFGTREQQTATTSVQRGAFSVSFDQPDPTCNLGGNRFEPAALYIDVNRDGHCTLADDDVFVWQAYGGPSGGRNFVSISPDVEPCAGGFSIQTAPYPVENVRDALRRLCPEVGDCLPFCRPPDPRGETLPDRYGSFCGRDPGIVTPECPRRFSEGVQKPRRAPRSSG